MQEYRAIEPVLLVTAEGRERRLFLTNGAMQRAKIALKIASLTELMKVDAELGLARIFYEAQDKDARAGETFEDFLEVLPFNMELQRDVFERLIGLHGAKSANPPEPAAPAN